MLAYNGDWQVIEGSLTEERLDELPDCLEKEHLAYIRKLLKAEGFTPDEFSVHEYPTDGVYVCCRAEQADYFMVQEVEGYLYPHYVTEQANSMGINNFPCGTITESIAKMEC